MTLEERMAAISREEMLLREQHGRARARLSDILDVCTRPHDDLDADDLSECLDEIEKLAIAGLKED